VLLVLLRVEKEEQHWLHAGFIEEHGVKVS